MRRFHWLASMAAVEVKDSDGDVISSWLVALPYMKQVQEAPNEHKRKVYLAGVGMCTSIELGKCLIAQSDYIREHGLECWVCLTPEKVSRNFAFLKMDPHAGVLLR